MTELTLTFRLWPFRRAVYVPLSPAQRFWYKRLLTRADTVTLGEIFNSDDFKAPDGRGRKGKAAIKNDAEDEGDAGVREHVEKAIAASKSGEGNAWMKMMNLCVDSPITRSWR